MRKIFNKFTIISICCWGVFLLLLILLSTVDEVENHVGSIGLYSLNKSFLVSRYDENWDVLSDVVLYFSLAFAGGLMIYGLNQLITRKSFFKVDKDILFAGGGILLILVLWFLFDKAFVVNYRPILIDDFAYASFPSTHVMFSTFVLLVSCRIIIKRNPYTLVYSIAGYVGMSFLILISTLGRILSCMHWMTDVLGGVCIGLGLYFLVLGLDKIFENKKKNLNLE